MKRLFALLLVLCLVLCGCAGKPAETVPTTEATTEATTEPTTEPTTVPTEPPVIYRNPLNGTILEEAYTGRAVAVVINNLVDCLPQFGIGDADFMYEAETEGGITRFLAVFSDLTQVGSIGPVRSARTFFNSLALSHGAPIIHCGGSDRGRNGYADRTGSKISDWEHIDQTYNGSYFFRDQARLNSGFNYEHTLFTTGEELIRGTTAKEFDMAKQVDYGYIFEEEPQVEGYVANKLVVNFRNNKTTSFTYDAETKLYAAEQYGIKLVDGADNAQLQFRNVLVVYADQSFQRDSCYSRSYYEIVGEGEGQLAVNGVLTTIKWTRADQNSPFVYTYEDGTPVTLGVGKTYVAIACDEKASVDFE
ncbi:MAG: DUF3048 domain-containing protein [Oscillospiraceae bacterium]|nr:DUF3048 domain-containing protein [Oscillospiraceae bacterium]